MTELTLGVETAPLDVAYESAHKEAIFVDHSDLGYLKFSGETRLDLINRMSTQKVDELKPGQGTATILTSDIGRIVDRLILYAGLNHVYCLTGSDNGDGIARYLMRFVFFMDDFHIEDLSHETAITGVYGPKSARMVRSLVGENLEFEPHHWRNDEIEGVRVSLHRTDPIAGEGYLIAYQIEDMGRVNRQLVSVGAVPADKQAFEYLRIESGQPVYGRELTPDYIPLEAGLRQDISFNKGCYTGQEIIARMDSRGKLAKRLVKLSPDAPIEVGAALRTGGKNAGIVTSVSDGPAGIIALGYLKSAFLSGSSGLTAGEVGVKVLDVPGESYPPA